MKPTEIDAPNSKAMIEVRVRNHAGVMSHVCGLFARRTYNVEGILCLPLDDGMHSRIWLWVNEDARLEQILLQTRKLIDVQDVKLHHAVSGDNTGWLEQILLQQPG